MFCSNYEILRQKALISGISPS